MVIEILENRHLDDAAQLCIKSLKQQLEVTPVLDEALMDETQIKNMISSCIDMGQGVAAVDNGVLIGYMTGIYIDELLGPVKGILVPEWGHAVQNGREDELYRSLYREASRQWMKQGALTHVVVMLNSAARAQETMSWNGFGFFCLDAARPVEEFALKTCESVEVKAITREMIPEWSKMVRDHYRHILEAPVFKPDFEIPDENQLEEMLSEDGNRAWMAFVSDQPAGYMKIAPSEDGASWIVNGSSHFAVNGAYTKPEFRGSGVAPALLNHIMAWGKQNGFKRCSVDFETSNPEACHFWLKYFKPVCKAMIRKVDPRVLDRVISLDDCI